MKKKKKKKELKPWMHIVALFIGVFLVAYLISFLLDSNSVFKSKFEIKNITQNVYLIHLGIIYMYGLLTMEEIILIITLIFL